MYGHWSYLPPVNQPGAPAVGAGGDGYRDVMDRKRAGLYPDTPTSAYPDGYLGTINSRRGDRLFDAVRRIGADKSYARGVHKGERMDPESYFWPKDFHPQIGLDYQAAGKKWTATGEGPQVLAHGGKHALTSPGQLSEYARKNGGVTDPQALRETDPKYAEKMRPFLPTWR